MIEELWEKESKLTQKDIKILKQKGKSLSVLSEFYGIDVFIDIIIDSETALVVSQSIPSDSIYGRNIVGEFAYRKNEPAVFRTYETKLPSKQCKAIAQNGKSIIQDIIPIFNEKKRVIGVLIGEVIENRKFTEDVGIFTRETVKFIEGISSFDETINDFLEEGIISFDKDEKVVYHNNSAKKIMEEIGRKSKLMGESFNNLPLNIISFQDVIQSSEENNNKIDIFKEINILNKFFKVKYVKSNCDKKSIINMIIYDITEEKAKEQELIYKSVAIKEIHHRVKNNLQTIASLLRMQKRRAKSEELKKILEENINRIMSIAITHELLSQNGFENLKIKTIISLMCNNFRKGSSEEKEISFNISGDDFYINSDKSTSVALVINEIIQNIWDHAFSDTTKKIKVKITVIKGELDSIITIFDNGVGIEKKISSKEGLGTTIIKAIIKDKLEGSYEVLSTKGKGTEVKMKFKN